MKYLLYCITRTPPEPPDTVLTGLGGNPVFLISCQGLSAVLSELPPAPGVPGGRELLDYNRVIENFHFRHGAIPVRYGSCFSDMSHVHDLLQQQSGQYLVTLDELTGNLEMSIRLLFRADQNHFEESSFSLPAATHQDEKGAANGLLTGKGRAFLAARKKYYGQTDQVSRCYTRATAYYSEVFSACCLRHVFETDEENSLLSLYFLVPGLRVEHFRETFRGIVKEGKERIMMSGPWPPYNFAKLDHHPIKALRPG